MTSDNPIWTGDPTLYQQFTLSVPFIIRVATMADLVFATIITEEMAVSAAARGTGIAKRSPDYVSKKMEEGKLSLH